MAQDPPTNNAQEHDVVLGKIGEIEKVVNEIGRMKQTRSLIMLVGVILILIALALFGVNLYGFFKSYDTEELRLELEQKVIVAAQSQEVKEVITELKDKVLPKLKNEIMKKVQADMPKFEAAAAKTANNLNTYVQSDLKKKILSALHKALEEMEKKLVAKYKNLKDVDLEAVFKEAEAEFVEKFTTSFELRCQKAIANLSALNDSLASIASDKELNELDKMKTSEIENKLIESMLELAIYHINPDKGDQPAQN